LLSSGFHSEYYFEKFRILENPRFVRRFSEVLAREFKSYDIEWVVGPFTGGAILAYDLASLMGIKVGYAEKVDNGRVLKRGFDVKGKKVAVVDDVLTTGRSIKDTIEAVKDAGGIPVVAGVMVKRGEVSLDIPLYCVMELEFPIYSPDECPMCKKGLELEIRGKGGV